MRAAIVIGSGRAAEAARTLDFGDNAILIALNNAWRVRKDFDYILYADDFRRWSLPFLQVRKWTNTQRVEAVLSEKFGPVIFRGSTMAFNGIYFALTLNPDQIFTIGCDMDYREVGGRTHFYGKGGKDPLRDNVSLRNLQAKSHRALCMANREGVVLNRIYDEEEGELALPRITMDQFARRVVNTAYSISKDTMNDALRREERAPFDAHFRKYWVHAKSPKAVDYVDRLDAMWLSSVKL